MFFSYLILFFLIGLAVPFLFLKGKSKRIRWIPAILFFIGTLLMGVKAGFFPGAGMADLGERIYFMILGVTTIGSIIGGIIVGYLKNK
jgi:hypothetical protein